MQQCALCRLQGHLHNSFTSDFSLGILLIENYIFECTKHCKCSGFGWGCDYTHLQTIMCVFGEALSHYIKGKGRSSDETHRLVKLTVQMIASPSIFAFVCRWSSDCLSGSLSLCNRGGFMCLADVIGVDWAQGEQTVLVCWFPRALAVILCRDPLCLGLQTLVWLSTRHISNLLRWFAFHMAL